MTVFNAVTNWAFSRIIMYLGLLLRIRRDREAKAKEEELAKVREAPKVV